MLLSVHGRLSRLVRLLRSLPERGAKERNEVPVKGYLNNGKQWKLFGIGLMFAIFVDLGIFTVGCSSIYD